MCRRWRRELRQRGIGRLTVVYSEEPPAPPAEPLPDGEAGERRATPGSLAFVPAAAGLVLAGEIEDAKTQIAILKYTALRRKGELHE